MERIEHHVCFGGSQEVWRHHSAVTGTPMTFSALLQIVGGDKLI
ncbi:TPA: S-formylglutathione hydrolase, partial [Klebsiella pneumoniae]|nr:S-formylglutathione hydrolase [Klebsiella pneumoniae]